MGNGRHMISQRITYLSLLALLAGTASCAAKLGANPGDNHELFAEDATSSDALSTQSYPVGTIMRVTASALNLRTGPSGGYSVRVVMPNDVHVTLVTSAPQSGWYNIRYGSTDGWAAGRYLSVVSTPSDGGSGGSGSSSSSPYAGTSCSNGASSGSCIDTSVDSCGGTLQSGLCPGPNNIECCLSTSGSSGSGGSGSGGSGSGGSGSGGSGSGSGISSAGVDGAIARARAGVGFSYYWGHGSWRSDGVTSSTAGYCSGSCPSCRHSGSYGADCSGFVAKAWQVPSSNTTLSSDSHPYSTYNFYNQSLHWSHISRTDIQRGDAMVYRSGGSGHIVLNESGSPWGQHWVYEARGCSSGIQHNLRSFSSSYHTIHRNGY